jgi:hypothetical protein
MKTVGNSPRALASYQGGRVVATRAVGMTPGPSLGRRLRSLEAASGGDRRGRLIRASGRRLWCRLEAEMVGLLDINHARCLAVACSSTLHDAVYHSPPSGAAESDGQNAWAVVGA